MSTKHIITALIFATASLTLSQAQNKTHQSDPTCISTGKKLPYRSNITPFDNRQTALSGTTSPFVIQLAEWERDTVNGNIRYTTRFKKTYTWDNRGVILRTEDVTSSFLVEVNGAEAGYSQTGSGRSEFDITKMTKPDYNTVSITIFPNATAKRIEGGRKNEIPSFKAASVLSPYTVMIQDISTNTRMDDTHGYITLSVVTKSLLLNPKEYTLFYEILNPEGETIAKGHRDVKTMPRSTDTTTFAIRFENPRKWDHETPDRYTVIVGSRNEGRIREITAVQTGIRTVGLTDGALTINGMKVPIYAVKYQANIDRELTKAKLEQFKSAGYNMIIVDGRPQPDFLYSLCDEIGLYVCDAADINTKAVVSAEFQDNPDNSPIWVGTYIDRIKSMYYSSQAHPSVVMFSPANTTTNGYGLYEGYLTLKQADAERPVFYTGADRQWNNDINAASINMSAPANYSPDKLTVSFIQSETPAVDIHNNLLMSTVQGTYNIRLKKGRKTISTKTGEFSLSGEETTRILLLDSPLSMPGVVAEVEINRLKVPKAPIIDENNKTDLSGYYETTKKTFEL